MAKAHKIHTAGDGYASAPKHIQMNVRTANATTARLKAMYWFLFWTDNCIVFNCPSGGTYSTRRRARWLRKLQKLKPSDFSSCYQNVIPVCWSNRTNE